MRMRQSNPRASRSLLLLAIVGSLTSADSRSASSQQFHSPLRVRSTAASMQVARRDCERAESPKTRLEIASLTLPSSAAASAVAACARGGAIDDEPPSRRSRGYDRYHDRTPPRRSSPPHVHDREGRGQQSEPLPRRDSREPDRSREGRPRPPMGERDGHYNRYNDKDDVGDRSRWDDRQNNEDGGDRRRRRNYSPADLNPDDGKSKKWFSFKKDNAKELSNDGNKKGEPMHSDPWGDIPPNPPPPPPPPPTDASYVSSREINPAGTSRTPIHYTFPTAKDAAEERKMSDEKMDDGAMGIDRSDGSGTDVMDTTFFQAEEVEFAGRDSSMDRRRRRRSHVDDRERIQASPRRDAITIFMSTRRGSFQVRLGSMIVGGALGGFIGKSLMNDPLTMGIVISAVLLFTGFLRNDYGELSRALGLAFVFTLKRTRSVRRDYPTLPHIKAIIRQGPRKPFPPVEDGGSPWKYEPVYRDDPDFKMTFALLSMVLVGSFCGGNIPILPAWIGGTVGAVAFASLATGSNARGDLGRTMGMRVVGLGQLILELNSELGILGKAATVGGLLFDKVMIMDRKHRIKDRIVAIGKWGYEKVGLDRIKEEMQDERPERL